MTHGVRFIAASRCCCAARADTIILLSRATALWRPEAIQTSISQSTVSLKNQRSSIHNVLRARAGGERVEGSLDLQRATEGPGGIVRLRTIVVREDMVVAAVTKDSATELSDF